MYDENKPTVVGGTNPWSEDDASQGGSQDNQRTVMDNQAGSDTSAPTVISDEGSPFQPTYPRQRRTPTTPFDSPPAAAPAPRPQPRPQPRQGGQAPAAGGSTVIMEGPPEIIPLAWLAVVEGVGDARGTVFTLRRETLVGRNAGDVVLNDPAVSGQHLKIRLEKREDDPEAEVYVLYDLASANGTFVGDYEACQKESNRVYRHLLEDGDYIQVGRTILVFKQV